VRFGWQEVAPLVGKPPAAPSAPPPSDARRRRLPRGAGRPALLETATATARWCGSIPSTPPASG
jgi:hypothetical protein